LQYIIKIYKTQLDEVLLQNKKQISNDNNAISSRYSYIRLIISTSLLYPIIVEQLSSNIATDNSISFIHNVLHLILSSNKDKK
jgi:hypothetical protein